MSLTQFPLFKSSVFQQRALVKEFGKRTVRNRHVLFLYAGIYANLSFKQYQKELKKLTKLVIAVLISYDRTYGYSWKIHQ